MTNNRLLNHLLAGNYRASSEIVKEMMDASVPITEIYENLFKPAMYKVGDLWEENKITVATEHLASAIVESLLNQMYLSYRLSANPEKTVIVTCLENEYHQIGARMVADVFELNGWKVFFLGANTPIKDLLEFIRTIQPSLICISLSIYFHLPVLHSTLEEIRKMFPELPVLTGGQAFKRGGSDTIGKYKNIRYLPDLLSLQSYLMATNR